MNEVIYVDTNELKQYLLELSIDFFNLQSLIGVSTGSYCGGCQSSVGVDKDAIKKMCDLISRTVSALESMEVLLSEDNMSESKIHLMDIIKEIISAVQFFLITSPHILNSEYSITDVSCHCNNHKNISKLMMMLSKFDKIKKPEI